MCSRYSKETSDECEDDTKYHKASMGSVIHQGQWKGIYPAQFTVSINDKLYLYGQSKQWNWFTREIFSNGSICDWDSSKGVWKRYYPINFQYSINKQHYHYKESKDENLWFKDENLWFIREVLEGGQMDSKKVTEIGKNGDGYVKVPFTIAGKQFFYSYKNAHWYIRALSPAGKLDIIQSSRWNAAYKSACIFYVKDTPYVYCAGEEKWIIHEIQNNAKMGPQTDQGFWAYEFDITFPFYLRGRQYLFAKSDTFWLIRELLPGGKMGAATDSGYLDHDYEVMLPFSIKEKTFIYGNSFKDNSWYIREVVIHC